MSHEDRDRARLERLARQSVIHHRKREEQLERLLADVLVAVDKGCRCRACRALRSLAHELSEAS